MELHIVCVAACRTIDSLAFSSKVCLQVSSKSGPEPWTAGVKTPHLLRGCSERKLPFCTRAPRGMRRLPRRVMRTKRQRWYHLSSTLRHLGHNWPPSVFLIYLIRWPVDIALSSFLCVSKLAGLNRFFFSPSQDTDKPTQQRQARNASTADSHSDCCSKNWWPQLFGAR